MPTGNLQVDVCRDTVGEIKCKKATTLRDDHGSPTNNSSRQSCNASPRFELQTTGWDDWPNPKEKKTQQDLQWTPNEKMPWTDNGFEATDSKALSDKVTHKIVTNEWDVEHFSRTKADCILGTGEDEWTPHAENTDPAIEW